MQELALITITSDRPLAFQLCERWMARAMAYFGRPVSWYVVDDGVEPAVCTLGQTHLRRPPAESHVESFLGNLLMALHCSQEPQKILVIEDDDWYAREYLAVYANWLDEAEIVGESSAKYYNPITRRFTQFENQAHASLCQTAIRGSLVPWFLNHVRQARDPFVDLELWTHAAASSSCRLEAETRICIGIKGLPGKVGFGEGHVGVSELDCEDETGAVLRSWIGDEDAAAYLALSEPNVSERAKRD